MKRGSKRAKIALKFNEMSVPELISFAIGIKLANDPDAKNPPVPEAVLKQQAQALQDTHQRRQTDKSAALTKVEREQTDKLVESLIADAAYVEGVANQKAQGDLPVAEEIILRTGFRVKKPAAQHQRFFEVVSTGPGTVHLRIKASAKREAVMWQYLVDPSNPATASPVIVTLESEVTITGLRSGVRHGFRYAVVLPAHGKRVVTAGSEGPVWSDMIFVVIP